MRVFVDATGVSAGQIAIIKDKSADAVGVAGCIAGGNDASLAESNQGKAPKTCGVDDGFEIADPCVETEIIDVAVRQARAARVITNESMAFGKRLKPVAPNCAIPIEFEMGKPICRPNQRRPWRGRIFAACGKS